jgi:hypothetical protein
MQLNESKAGKTFYEDDGFTISPRGGQVFIRINFNEPDDYDNETGTQVINNKIQFYNSPSKTDGVLYMVNAVTSNFTKGKFSQELDLFIAPTKFGSVTVDKGREDKKLGIFANPDYTSATMHAVPFEKIPYDKSTVLKSEPLQINTTGAFSVNQVTAFNPVNNIQLKEGESSSLTGPRTNSSQLSTNNLNPDDDNSWSKVVTISDYGAGRESKNTELPKGYTI